METNMNTKGEIMNSFHNYIESTYGKFIDRLLRRIIIDKYVKSVIVTIKSNSEYNSEYDVSSSFEFINE